MSSMIRRASSIARYMNEVSPDIYLLKYRVIEDREWGSRIGKTSHQ